MKQKMIEYMLSCRTILILLLLFISYNLCVRLHGYIKYHDVAAAYIHDLEEYIEQDGTVVGDVIGGDSYSDYYSR